MRCTCGCGTPGTTWHHEPGCGTPQPEPQPLPCTPGPCPWCAVYGHCLRHPYPDDYQRIYDSQPPDVLAVESLAWVDYGWGCGPTYVEDGTPESDETPLHFGRPRDGWKFYLGGKTFGPVRVTMLDGES